MSFHVGPKGPGECGVTVGTCPYGGASGTENHFGSLDAAGEVFAARQKAEHGAFCTVSRKKGVTVPPLPEVLTSTPEGEQNYQTWKKSWEDYWTKGHLSPYGETAEAQESEDSKRGTFDGLAAPTEGRGRAPCRKTLGDAREKAQAFPKLRGRRPHRQGFLERQVSYVAPDHISSHLQEKTQEQREVVQQELRATAAALLKILKARGLA